MLYLCLKKSVLGFLLSECTSGVSLVVFNYLFHLLVNESWNMGDFSIWVGWYFAGRQTALAELSTDPTECPLTQSFAQKNISGGMIMNQQIIVNFTIRRSSLFFLRRRSHLKLVSQCAQNIWCFFLHNNGTAHFSSTQTQPDWHPRFSFDILLLQSHLEALCINFAKFRHIWWKLSCDQVADLGKALERATSWESWERLVFTVHITHCAPLNLFIITSDVRFFDGLKLVFELALFSMLLMVLTNEANKKSSCLVMFWM